MVPIPSSESVPDLVPDNAKSHQQFWVTEMLLPPDKSGERPP